MTSDSSLSSRTGEPDTAPVPAPDWAAIRDAYVSQSATVREICQTHAIQFQTLYRMARRQCWPRRREGQGKARQRQERKSLQMLARLQRIAESQIDDIEARSARTNPASPGEPERDARALMALAKLIEHIAALEAKHQVGQDGTGGPREIDRARRRADLADKLIAMLEQERGAPLPEDHCR